VLANPKQKTANRSARLYPYYAGYAPQFVQTALRHPLMPSDGLIVDPWLGSGTTTRVCAELGRPSAGMDLNPAMVVVAKAQLLPRCVDSSLGKILATLKRRAKRLGMIEDDDALLGLFDHSSALHLRGFTSAIADVLIDEEVDGHGLADVNQLSALAAFFYVLVFRAARRVASSQQSSNPTWVKVPKEEKLSITRSEFEGAIDRELAAARTLLIPDKIGAPVSCDIRVSDSRYLPLQDGEVAGVITSPPYCTRIDYAVATRVELAILGFGHNDRFTGLRKSLIGSTLSSSPDLQEAALLPTVVVETLNRIQRHPSKASRGYYYRTFVDYFVGLNRSIGEIARILRPVGRSHGALF
jgi:SAM-dependent methyltransferase